MDPRVQPGPDARVGPGVDEGGDGPYGAFAEQEAGQEAANANVDEDGQSDDDDTVYTDEIDSDDPRYAEDDIERFVGLPHDDPFGKAPLPSDLRPRGRARKNRRRHPAREPEDDDDDELDDEGGEEDEAGVYACGATPLLVVVCRYYWQAWAWGVARAWYALLDAWGALLRAAGVRGAPPPLPRLRVTRSFQIGADGSSAFLLGRLAFGPGAQTTRVRGVSFRSPTRALRCARDVCTAIARLPTDADAGARRAAAQAAMAPHMRHATVRRWAYHDH